MVHPFKQIIVKSSLIKVNLLIIQQIMEEQFHYLILFNFNI